MTTGPARSGNRYLAALDRTGALRFSAAAFIGRLQISMFGLGTVLLVSSFSGRYGRAGLVAAAGAAQRDGVLRADVSMGDVVLLLETLSAVTVPDPGRGQELRRRYLVLLLQALRSPGGGPLPGPAADPAELAARWLAGTAAPVSPA